MWLMNVYSSKWIDAQIKWILIYFLRHKELDYLKDNCSLHM